MITMAVAGLWHGASWNFIIWGAYHGALLCLERMWRVRHRRRPGGGENAVDLHALQVACTFLLFAMGAPFFRLAAFSDAVHVVRLLFIGPPGTILLNSWQMGLLAVALVAAHAEEKFRWFERIAAGPAWAYASAMTVLLLCLSLFAVTDNYVPFIYFQF